MRTIPHLECTRKISTLALMCLSIALTCEARANAMQPVIPIHEQRAAPQAAMHSALPAKDSVNLSAETSTVTSRPLAPLQKLIVIGFMGGNVNASNTVHPEALLIRTLQESHPLAVHAAIFANRHGETALKTILQFLDKDKDGHLSDDEKKAARIAIFGHSWGASETIWLSRKLNQLGIPVLLTVQVDSVQKRSQNDVEIPPNVHEAVNFYQSEGLLHGRSRIVATDPEKTTVLGNYQSSYRENPISCAGYPWYARAFMKRHIQIENDPAIWSKVEALILAKIR